MIKTRITELLGTKYPVLIGGMQWLSKAELVASVCNAGGFGFITSLSFNNSEEVRQEIKKCRELTDQPFGINISMLPDISSGEMVDELMDLAISERIPVIETSGRSPGALVAKAKPAGIKIIHKVPSARHAVSAEKAGVDAVILVGYEAGGHPGMDQVGTFVNLPAAVRAVKVPVVAAGGVCDAKSFIAALALGAEGVMMGTRFLATQEAPVHQNIKDWILQAKETDTIITQRSINNAMRSIKNEQTYKVLGLEQVGTKLKDLLPHISGKLSKEAWQAGDLSSATLPMGQVVGLIHDLPTLKELLEGMMAEVDLVMAGLNSKCRA